MPQDNEKPTDIENASEELLEAVDPDQNPCQELARAPNLGDEFEALGEAEKQVALHFLHGKFSIPDNCPELFDQMIATDMGRNWAAKMRDRFVGKDLSQENPGPAAKRLKLGGTSDLTQDALDKLEGRINGHAELSFGMVEAALQDLSRALWESAGPELKFLFRMLSTSPASHFPANWDTATTFRFGQDDRLITEMRTTLSLVKKLNSKRGPANGGLLLQNILLLHAQSAMASAWRILSSLALVSSATLDTVWETVLLEVGRFRYHTTKVFTNEFSLIIRLDSWLADANGPRSARSETGDRLEALRDILFPTDSDELGSEESYEAYGLRELDAVQFNALGAPQAEDPRASAPLDILPIARPTGHAKSPPPADLLSSNWVQEKIKSYSKNLD